MFRSESKSSATNNQITVIQNTAVGSHIRHGSPDATLSDPNSVSDMSYLFGTGGASFELSPDATNPNMVLIDEGDQGGVLAAVPGSSPPTAVSQAQHMLSMLALQQRRKMKAQLLKKQKMFGVPAGGSEGTGGKGTPLSRPMKAATVGSFYGSDRAQAAATRQRQPSIMSNGSSVAEASPRGMSVPPLSATSEPLPNPFLIPDSSAAAHLAGSFAFGNTNNGSFVTAGLTRVEREDAEHHQKDIAVNKQRQLRRANAKQLWHRAIVAANKVKTVDNSTVETAAETTELNSALTADGPNGALRGSTLHEPKDVAPEEPTARTSCPKPSTAGLAGTASLDAQRAKIAAKTAALNSFMEGKVIPAMAREVWQRRAATGGARGEAQKVLGSLSAADASAKWHPTVDVYSKRFTNPTSGKQESSTTTSQLSAVERRVKQLQDQRDAMAARHRARSRNGNNRNMVEQNTGNAASRKHFDDLGSSADEELLKPQTNMGGTSTSPKTPSGEPPVAPVHFDAAFSLNPLTAPCEEPRLHSHSRGQKNGTVADSKSEVRHTPQTSVSLRAHIPILGQRHPLYASSAPLRQPHEPHDDLIFSGETEYDNPVVILGGHRYERLPVFQIVFDEPMVASDVQLPLAGPRQVESFEDTSSREGVSPLTPATAHDVARKDTLPTFTVLLSNAKPPVAIASKSNIASSTTTPRRNTTESKGPSPNPRAVSATIRGNAKPVDGQPSPKGGQEKEGISSTATSQAVGSKTTKEITKPAASRTAVLPRSVEGKDKPTPYTSSAAAPTRPPSRQQPPATARSPQPKVTPASKISPTHTVQIAVSKMPPANDKTNYAIARSVAHASSEPTGPPDVGQSAPLQPVKQPSASVSTPEEIETERHVPSHTRRHQLGQIDGSTDSDTSSASSPSSSDDSDSVAINGRDGGYDSGDGQEDSGFVTRQRSGTIASPAIMVGSTAPAAVAPRTQITSHTNNAIAPAHLSQHSPVSSGSNRALTSAVYSPVERSPNRNPSASGAGTPPLAPQYLSGARLPGRDSPLPRAQIVPRPMFPTASAATASVHAFSEEICREADAIRARSRMDTDEEDDDATSSSSPDSSTSGSDSSSSSTSDSETTTSSSASSKGSSPGVDTRPNGYASATRSPISRVSFVASESNHARPSQNNSIVMAPPGLVSTSNNYLPDIPIYASVNYGSSRFGGTASSGPSSPIPLAMRGPRAASSPTYSIGSHGFRTPLTEDDELAHTTKAAYLSGPRVYTPAGQSSSYGSTPHTTVGVPIPLEGRTAHSPLGAASLSSPHQAMAASASLLAGTRTHSTLVAATEAQGNDNDTIDGEESLGARSGTMADLRLRRAAIQPTNYTAPTQAQAEARQAPSIGSSSDDSDSDSGSASDSSSSYTSPDQH